MPLPVITSQQRNMQMGLAWFNLIISPCVANTTFEQLLCRAVDEKLCWGETPRCCVTRSRYHQINRSSRSFWRTEDLMVKHIPSYAATTRMPSPSDSIRRRDCPISLKNQ